jgi:hypothetical protein
MRRIPLAIVLLLVALGVAGCPPTRRIGYGLEDVSRLGGGRFAQSVLVVEPFADARTAGARIRRQVTLDPAAIVVRGEDEWYANSDDAYVGPSVAMGVSQAIVDHLGRTRMFREVRLGPGDGDLRLSGALAQFDGYEERDAAARSVVRMGGILPLIVGTTRRARHEATVVLKDVTLVDVPTQATLWRGDVDGHLEGDNVLIASNEAAVFVNANVALKLAVSQLVDRLVAVQTDAR